MARMVLSRNDAVDCDPLGTAATIAVKASKASHEFAENEEVLIMELPGKTDEQRVLPSHNSPPLHPDPRRSSPSPPALLTLTYPI
jgi:hypothetical protein